MINTDFNIIKSTGKEEKFSIDKLRASLKSTGANTEVVNQIIKQINNEIYAGISSKEIYTKAFTYLRKKAGYLASRYKLKKAIYELGPTGFPFERFIAAILKYSGYSVKVGSILNGTCVTHEIDVLATKNKETLLIECKFHSDSSLNCNVKIPLYINSRYQDVKTFWNINKKKETCFTKAWIVTNTRFTLDAATYGECAGLYLVGWDYPKNEGLKDKIDALGLYPITASTVLTKREKKFLLSRDVILCRTLVNDKFYLDHLRISEPRKRKLWNEIEQLCTI